MRSRETPAVDPSLQALYEEVDSLAAALQNRHAERLQCRRGCRDCCVDQITVFEVEADQIRNHYGALLAGGRPHPEGACAFLDTEGACRIYPHRPYVCRTQGFPLRWAGSDDSGQPVEYRDICPLNDHGTPLEELDAGDCWTLGHFEAELAELQVRCHEGQKTRVALRDLFGSRR